MNILATKEEFNGALEESKQTRILLFKHSTQCPISAAAHEQVEKFGTHTKHPVFMVKVIEDRPLSNHIAEQLKVRHASPQVLAVEDGRVVWNASHYDITERALDEAFGGK